eukprot:5284142-Pleurochrysis_carterae.AAC.1
MHSPLSRACVHPHSRVSVEPQVLADGSAAGASPSLMAKDQLVAVDSTVVLGASFETSIEAIKATTGETTRYTQRRRNGPSARSKLWGGR